MAFDRIPPGPTPFQLKNVWYTVNVICLVRAKYCGILRFLNYALLPNIDDLDSSERKRHVTDTTKNFWADLTVVFTCLGWNETGQLTLADGAHATRTSVLISASFLTLPSGYRLVWVRVIYHHADFGEAHNFGLTPRQGLGRTMACESSLTLSG